MLMCHFVDLTNSQQNDYKIKWDKTHAKVGQHDNTVGQMCPTLYELSDSGTLCKVKWDIVGKNGIYNYSLLCVYYNTDKMC